MAKVEESQALKEIKELVERITKRIEAYKEKISELETEIKTKQRVVVEKCWAGIPMSECPYQKVGELIQVNTSYCSGCYLIDYIRENLFSAVEEIFGKEIEKITEKEIEKEVEENLNEAKDEVRDEYEEELRKIKSDLNYILDEL